MNDAAAPAPPGGLPVILTVREVAALARRAPRTVDRAAQLGLLRRIAPGRYRAQDVEAWIAAGMPSGPRPRNDGY
jgi:hypothetical protein